MERIFRLASSWSAFVAPETFVTSTIPCSLMINSTNTFPCSFFLYASAGYLKFLAIWDDSLVLKQSSRSDAHPSSHPGHIGPISFIVTLFLSTLPHSSCEKRAVVENKSRVRIRKYF